MGFVAKIAFLFLKGKMNAKPESDVRVWGNIFGFIFSILVLAAGLVFIFPVDFGKTSLRSI